MICGCEIYLQTEALEDQHDCRLQVCQKRAQATCVWRPPGSQFLGSVFPRGRGRGRGRQGPEVPSRRRTGTPGGFLGPPQAGLTHIPGHTLGSPEQEGACLNPNKSRTQSQGASARVTGSANSLMTFTPCYSPCLHTDKQLSECP